MDRKGGKNSDSDTLYFKYNLSSIISKHFLFFSLNHFLELFLLKNGPSREKG